MSVLVKKSIIFLLKCCVVGIEGSRFFISLQLSYHSNLLRAESTYHFSVKVWSTCKEIRVNACDSRCRIPNAGCFSVPLSIKIENTHETRETVRGELRPYKFSTYVQKCTLTGKLSTSSKLRLPNKVPDLYETSAADNISRIPQSSCKVKLEAIHRESLSVQI